MPINIIETMTGTDPAGGAASITLTRVAAVQAGDILLAFVWCTSGLPINLIGPALFEEEVEFIHPTIPELHGAIFYKRIDAHQVSVEPTTYLFSGWGAVSGYGLVVMYLLRGADLFTPVDARGAAGSSPFGTSSHSIPGVTPRFGLSRIFAMIGGTDGPPTAVFTSTAGFTKLNEISIADRVLAIFDRGIIAPGTSSDAMAVTSSQPYSSQSMQIAISEDNVPPQPVAPEFAATSTKTGISTSSLTLNEPAPLLFQGAHLLIAFVSFTQFPTSPPDAFTATPAGWTLLSDVSVAGIRRWMGFKLAGGGSPGPHTWATALTDKTWCGQILAYRLDGPAAPIPNSNNVTDPFGPPSVTVGAGKLRTRLLYLYCQDADTAEGRTIASDAATVERTELLAVNAGAPRDLIMGSADEVKPVRGSSILRTFDVVPSLISGSAHDTTLLLDPSGVFALTAANERRRRMVGFPFIPIPIPIPAPR